MISEGEVKHIAKLARLGVSSAETKSFQKELSSILDYIEKLKEVDISNIESTSHSIKIENITREDKASVVDAEVKKKLLSLTPEAKDGFLKTKSIL